MKMNLEIHRDESKASMTQEQIVTQTILTEVRELLYNPDHWTQLAMARDEQMNTVQTNSVDARCFCLFGAIEKISNKNNVTYSKVMNTLERAIRIEGFNLTGNVIDFNDDSNRMHHEIIKALDTAIAIA